MNLRILGAHGNEAKGARLTSLLLDDVLAVDAGGLTASLTLAEQEKIRAVLLSHHHFDHSRDLVTLGFNAALWDGQVKVYALRETLDVVISCLLDGKIYANLREYPSKERATLQFETIEPYKEKDIEGYRVLALPVKHSVPTVGYHIASPRGGKLFYTSDTGPGLAECWRHVSPDLVICESFLPDSMTERAGRVGHLSPRLLKEELVQFRQLKGYLPRVIVIHLALSHEREVGQEIARIAGELEGDISLGCEDMEVAL